MSYISLMKDFRSGFQPRDGGYTLLFLGDSAPGNRLSQFLHSYSVDILGQQDVKLLKDVEAYDNFAPKAVQTNNVHDFDIGKIDFFYSGTVEQAMLQHEENSLLLEELLKLHDVHKYAYYVKDEAFLGALASGASYENKSINIESHFDNNFASFLHGAYGGSSFKGNSVGMYCVVVPSDWEVCNKAQKGVSMPLTFLEVPCSEDLETTCSIAQNIMFSECLGRFIIRQEKQSILFELMTEGRDLFGVDRRLSVRTREYNGQLRLQGL